MNLVGQVGKADVAGGLDAGKLLDKEIVNFCLQVEDNRLQLLKTLM